MLLSQDAAGNEKLTGFVPPIVEETKELGAYLLDGSHRANLGRWAGRKTMKVIYLSDIREDCPAYAYPNEWTEVKTYDLPPVEPALRKHYREGNLYALYRDFGTINGSRPRYK
jgi:hypothetical protein